MLKHCWEIKNCGRQRGGEKVHELGVCKAYPNNGHSCWVVAGTFCKGEVQGTFAKKYKQCMVCEVYKLYSTSFGFKKDDFKEEFPEEFDKCQNFFIKQNVANPEEEE